MTNLDQFSKILEDGGLDTNIADGVLFASKENPDYSLEITIDSAGGCLIKKTIMEKRSSKSILVLNQKIPKISFSSKTSQIRVKIVSESDLFETLKLISTPLF